MSKKDPQEVPARVRAAQEFVDSCRCITDPIIFMSIQSVPGRDLNPREQSTYDAALSALRLYFLGEMDYAGEPEPELEEGRARAKRRR
jgi:hypothetical protein